MTNNCPRTCGKYSNPVCDVTRQYLFAISTDRTSRYLPLGCRLTPSTVEADSLKKPAVLYAVCGNLIHTAEQGKAAVVFA